MSGYVTDTAYSDTFFRELSPAWLNYVAALNGVAPRPLDSAFRYLELGCGFGTSAVINAAAFPHASFEACDLNELHIEAGRAYAAHLGATNIQLHASSFDDWLTRPTDPYDFIVLHGVYSWVDAPTREVLRQLIARLLRRGGLLYVSYNALPGWSAELPLRRLLVELAPSEARTAGDKAHRAAAEIDALRKAGFRFFTANPSATSAVDAYTRGEGQYLAHEFMNAAWEPFYAVDVADDFATIGLEPVGSATLAHNHLALVLDTATTDAIGRLPTRRQRQLAVDFAINQRFRRDVFVRPDGSPPSPDHLEQTPIGCVTDEEIGMTARVPRGDIRFQDAFILDLRALFDRRSWRVGDVVARLSRKGQDASALARNLAFLIAAGVLAPFARPFEAPARPVRLANPFVERALAEVSPRAGRHVIPSAVYGNGVELDTDTVGLLREWARGAPVPPAFQARHLPMLSRLGIVS